MIPNVALAILPAELVLVSHTIVESPPCWRTRRHRSWNLKPLLLKAIHQVIHYIWNISRFQPRLSLNHRLVVEAILNIYRMPKYGSDCTTTNAIRNYNPVFSLCSSKTDHGQNIDILSNSHWRRMQVFHHSKKTDSFERTPFGVKIKII